jgi:hypothetical protein
MKQKAAKWGLPSFMVVLSATVLLFFYQNCGKAGFEGQEFNDLSSVQSIDPRLANLPFPYKVSVNQIAFTSCPIVNAGPETSTSTYFTWKVGAFDNNPQSFQLAPAGLQINPKFQTEFAKVASTYSPDMQPVKLKEALMFLPSVADTKLQLSFRSPNRTRTDLMAMPTFDANVRNAPVSSFMTPVSSNAVADAFKALPTTPINFFQGAENFSERALATTLNIPSSMGAYQSLLYTTYSSHYLTLGFMKTDATSTDGLAGPSSDPQSAYGVAFVPRFGRSNPFHSFSGEPVQAPFEDSLDGLAEVDPETNANVPAGWDCKYRFKIVRPADAYKTVYRGANNFDLVNGVCPGGGLNAAVEKGCYLNNGNSQFALPASTFNLGGNCPSNRTPRTSGNYCIERYAYACPSEPYAVPTGANEIAQTTPYRRGDGVYGSATEPERPQLLNALRRFLPADKWEINVSQRCVVPKNDNNACYGNNNIVYDETFFPGNDANATVGMYAGCGVDGQPPCAAYLTLCVRR